MQVSILAAEIFLLVAAFFQTASIGLVGLRTWRKHGPSGPEAKPAITILRPVCGIENHIEETLASGLRLTYPDYETIFCVASASDPIVPVVERLIAAHPGAKARILIGDDAVSPNPKLNNLVKGWAAASHEWIVMVDSNVLMPPDYVERLLSVWSAGTGLVCSPPAGIAPEGVWAELECGFLNTFQARWQLAADSVGLGFAQGKTMLWRREILEGAGGIAALASELAEDAASTKVVRAAGLKVRLVPQPFAQPLGPRRLQDVWRRQVRWARLRRASFRLLFMPEILAGGFLPLLAAAYLVSADVLPLVGALSFATAWYAAEAILAFRMGWPLSFRSPLIWIFRDAMLPWLWLTAICGNGFVWRGNTMSVGRAATARRQSGVEVAAG